MTLLSSGSAIVLALATTAFTTTTAQAQAANAQSQSPATAESAAGDVTSAAVPTGDIVVTAQKRAQNLQVVPVAVQVVTGAQLAAQGVRAFTDLTRTAPSLVVRDADQPVNASLSIRGIGTFAYSIGVEPSVAVQVDDVPIAFQARAFADLSDVARIEVLRGPQSTLYGKSASAGLINIVTEAPSSTFTAKVHGLVTSDNEYTVGGSISGPIGNKLRYRITANRDDFDGNVYNLFTGHKTNGRTTNSVRGKVLFDATDTLRLTLGLDYIDGSTTLGRPFFNVDPNAELRTANVPASVFAPGVNFGPGNRDVSNNAPSGTRYHGFGQSLKGELDLGGPTLVSVTSHDQYVLHDFLDFDDTSVASPDNRQIGTFYNTQWTQELRLVSPSHDPFRYTLGLFYADVNYRRPFQRGPGFSLAHWYATAGSQQAAAFGQVEYDLFAHTTLIGGLRFQHEKVSYTFLDYLANNALYNGNAKDNFLTYRLGAQQKLTPDIMVYLNYATGHKGQTYDLTTGFDQNRANGGPVKPEESGSWEIGARTQFFDHHLTVNLTAFDANYRNFQAQGIEALPDGTLNFRLTNVGRIRTKGIELETTTRLGNLTLVNSVAYLDARITEFPFAQCYPGQTAAQGCTGTPQFQNLAGSRPAQAPGWKLTSTADYTHSVGNLPFDGVLQAAFSYQSAVNYSLNQDPQTEQKGYGIVNLSIGIRAQNKKYEVMAFVNNLTNTHYYANIYDTRGNFGGLTATQGLLARDYARYAGIRVNYTF